MKTENSEINKVIHEGAEVYLNGTHLGNGEVEYEVETPYEEVRSGEWGPETLTRPAKRAFKITMPEGAGSLQGDWIIKRYTPDGNIEESTFRGQEEARGAIQALRELSLEGHFELVCRPRSEDMVVASYRHEPEKEPLAKPLKEESGGFDREQEFDPDYIYTDRDGDEWECINGRWVAGTTHVDRVARRKTFPGHVSLPEGHGPYRKDRLVPESAEEDDGLDREKSYRDDAGDTWTYFYDLEDRHPGWYFQDEERGPHYGPFPDPLLGPHEEVKNEEEEIGDARELLKSRRYLDSEGCVWEYRIHPGNDRPDWHYRSEGSRDWDPFRFHTPVDGPWTEYHEED